MVQWVGQRRATGIGLLAGGLIVLGLWTFLGWLVPNLLLLVAIPLAWRHSIVGVSAAVMCAGVLLWIGLTFGWVAWTVGLLLTGSGVLLLVWPQAAAKPQGSLHG